MSHFFANLDLSLLLIRDLILKNLQKATLPSVEFPDIGDFFEDVTEFLV